MNNDTEIMWYGYALPTIAVSLFILGILFSSCHSAVEPDPYQMNGVNRAEVIGRWEGK